MKQNFDLAAETINKSRHTTVFTGSGISVESGIPPFRGQNGIWNKYDPSLADIGYFRSHPDKSWAMLKEVFFDHFGSAAPNEAHKRIAELEKKGYVKAVITQNVDNLHQEAGSKIVHEFHGTSRTISCLICRSSYEMKQVSLETLPPRCPSCMGLLKPDFIFFGEGIPKKASMPSFYEAQVADVFLVIGTTGEVMPACQVPILAKENGAKIIEINIEPSNFTYSITDIFLQGKATEMMSELFRRIE
jgi:NAD-dependent deacetylase